MENKFNLSAKLCDIGTAAARFFDLLPALLLALLSLRAAELYAGLQPGAAFPQICAAAARVDALSLVRYLPVIFLYSLPFLLLRSRRAAFWLLGLAWTLLVLVQAALVEYFLTARVPLGSDLFAYSWHEIVLTVSGGGKLNLTVAAGLVLALTALWTVLSRQGRRLQAALPRPVAAALLAIALGVLTAASGRPGPAPGADTEDAHNLALNKTVFFFDDSIAYLARAGRKAGPGRVSRPAATPAAAGFNYLDPAFPFLRTEQTPDVLGPYFQIKNDAPPNLVFILVEGLGRAFSGPGALLGSFTPHLDELAGGGLYWENFLATQGRTFGVLPSLFASLPFGAKGFSDLEERMPAHASLLSVLKGQGYRLKFYSGFDLHFDNEDVFFRREGMDVLVGENDYGPGYAHGNSWGYADNELVSRALEGEARDAQQPFLAILQTITMHTPYTFPGQARYRKLFEQRLDQLGVPEEKKNKYRVYSNIYESILYTDEALGRFIEETKKNASYANTIFIITGDHRLPEIPMDTRIDRYHVPLLIVSPLLKAPASIKSVSSHFDVAPSLLAFLSDNYGILTPSTVTWLGAGLDTEPSFRNIHDLPMKQTITNLVDFVTGNWFTNQGALYRLKDGMAIEPASDAAALALVENRFAAFRAANDQFASGLALVPEGFTPELVPYRGEDRIPLPAVELSSAAVLSVRSVTVPDRAKAGQLTIEAVFANTGLSASDTFIPLAVLLTTDESEVSESYGPPQKLAPGGTITLQLPIKSQGAVPGNYYLAVFPSDPNTGKRSGEGKFKVSVLIVR